MPSSLCSPGRAQPVAQRRANAMQAARFGHLREWLIKIIVARVSSPRKWQPEYQTQRHQINHLAIALRANLCRFFRPRILFPPVPSEQHIPLSLFHAKKKRRAGSRPPSFQLRFFGALTASSPVSSSVQAWPWFFSHFPFHQSSSTHRRH